MGTISREIAEKIMSGDEKYGASVIRIVTYNNQFDGGLTYAIVQLGEDPNRYHESPACKNTQTIWDALVSPRMVETMQMRTGLNLRRIEEDLKGISSIELTAF